MDATAPPSAALGDADVAAVATLIGDSRRARVLIALADGRALPAGRLASEAGVAASTASEHLAKLRTAGLVEVEAQGRSRYYRLASSEVALALEALARIAPALPVRSLRQSTHAYALRRARTCYNHLAGRLGVAVMAALLRGGHLVGGDGRHRPDAGSPDRLSAAGKDVEYRLSSTGRRLFAELGVDLATVFRHHPAIRYCVDWTEQQHHLAGPLGTALCDRMLALGWLVRIDRPRVIAVTDRGRRQLTAVLGVDTTWYR